MRQRVGQQRGLVFTPVAHEHAREFAEMGQLMDDMEYLADYVQADLLDGVANPDTGRPGMTGDLVLRALIVKQMNGYSYEQLAFHLADSSTYRSFCRIGFADVVPSAKTLQRNIKKLRPETLEEINRRLMGLAVAEGVEDGAKMRGDCTVTASNIHHPVDSSLLDDCVRVLTRLLHRVKELVHIGFTDHTRRVHRRAIAIANAKRQKHRIPFYKEMIKLTEKTVRAAERAAAKLECQPPSDPMAALRAKSLVAELRHYLEPAVRVIDQTRRRVLEQETVPAVEKVVSIFEPHTDIIRKDNRDTYYGHKVYLSSGASGLVTDCVVLDGNPCDSTLVAAAITRHEEIFGQLPEQVAFDGGFASRSNLEAAHPPVQHGDRRDRHEPASTTSRRPGSSARPRGSSSTATRPPGTAPCRVRLLVGHGRVHGWDIDLTHVWHT